jgi:hypothetical protein
MARPERPERPTFKIKNIIIILVIVAAVWAFTIQTHSRVLLIITSSVTVIAAGVFGWALRAMSKQKKLVALLEGATASPEARAAAIAKLSEGKGANDIVNVIARSQLVAQDDPAKALEMLEKYQLKDIPAQLQDDYAIFRSQLYLQFGRPKDARPLVDMVNFDNFEKGERRQTRAFVAAVMGEAWGRTDRAADALALLAKIDLAKEEPQVQAAVLAARAFANFASGKRKEARADLDAIAALDVNQLGRFVHPRFKVHPELQKLARQVAEKNPAMRKMANPRGGRQPRQR